MDEARQTTLAAETPSGKGAADENFPVGSILLPKRLRPHVARYYAFARAIDDVADDAEASAEQKIARLDRFAAAIAGQPTPPGYDKAARLGRHTLDPLGIPHAHALDLISAFRQDAVKTRYADWAELIDYCNRSACPVGRFLLDLHGEDRAGYSASDALCNALQVINHLQDCGDDRAALDRIYLPQDWMAEAGATNQDLDGAALSPGLRRVVDRCLDATQDLLAHAWTLPGQLKSRRLAWESAVILQIADDLVARLRRRDPLASRVELSKPESLWAAVRGIARTF
ncbi:squalene synthase HpnC [Rhodothalassium salexigens]|uniref:squalene synthase HpnC n=1 Tax=Rhodothalassium salexigens TaxID=1086 RepID=UPI0019125B79|nr:squalene synthase HpnC [Rhodothalassium salexigens]MBK5911683.1 squalene synthase HpnC [Rhodothalassium salexigens]MBK5919967.1 squalene synthase HpnC [Rhodothalassium salexigens]